MRALNCNAEQVIEKALALSVPFSFLVSSFACYLINLVLVRGYISKYAGFSRLQAESERLKEVGPLAYYSEWVKAWKRDTSREAVQKHFEDTGEDENTQLIEMFTHQTDREYRIMMGTDTRVRRDPLAMRMREDQIKQSIYSKAHKSVNFYTYSILPILFFKNVL